jgi:hypothetical protein
VRIPALPAGKRPNFIVVLTDDQGYDDMGWHQPQQPGGKPQWVSTPNLDRFMQQSMEFRNFYVSPMCSQSRAELLTGRTYQRTGTMLINGGMQGAGTHAVATSGSSSSNSSSDNIGACSMAMHCTRVVCLQQQAAEQLQQKIDLVYHTYARQHAGLMNGKLLHQSSQPDGSHTQQV